MSISISFFLNERPLSLFFADGNLELPKTTLPETQRKSLLMPSATAGTYSNPHRAESNKQKSRTIKKNHSFGKSLESEIDTNYLNSNISVLRAKRSSYDGIDPGISRISSTLSDSLFNRHGNQHYDDDHVNSFETQNPISQRDERFQAFINDMTEHYSRMDTKFKQKNTRKYPAESFRGVRHEGPIWLVEPPRKVVFSNSSGGRVDCQVGSVASSIHVTWHHGSSRPIITVRTTFGSSLTRRNLSRFILVSKF